MKIRSRVIELQVADYVEDSVDDAAFAVNFQINGPGRKVDYLRVSFAEEFIEEYFRITWRQNLVEVTHRLIHEKRDLFVRWAVWRVERWLDGGRKEHNLIFYSGVDAIWAKKIEQGLIHPKSEKKADDLFVYTMTGKEK